MAIVKTYKKGNVTLQIADDCIPKDKEEYKKNLRKFYDKMNILFKGRPEFFYTKEEIETLKRTQPERFI